MSKNSGVTGKTVPQLARSIGALKRKEARANRSTAEQLALLDSRPGQALRERTRLGAA